MQSGSRAAAVTSAVCGASCICRARSHSTNCVVPTGISAARRRSWASSRRGPARSTPSSRSPPATSAVKVGRGIETAANAFADFAKSVNRRLLPQAGKLDRLGVQTSKALPASVPAYEVRRLEDAIEGEAEEIEAPQPRPRLIAE